MRRLGTIILALAVWVGAQAAPFQNLDFEAADLPVIPRGQEGTYVPISIGLPGWSASLGTSALSQVLHNSATLGSPAVLIWGPDMSYATAQAGGRIEGDFTAVLQAGTAASGPPLSISQTGLVPLEGQWLLFKGRVGFVPPMPTVFSVSLNDQNVPIAASLPEYTLYGGDVSTFVGTEAELKFTVYRGLGNGLILDSIEFSPVPEPGSFVLVALGLVAGACWRRIYSKPARA
jgi:hypothetical protein